MVVTNVELFELCAAGAGKAHCGTSAEVLAKVWDAMTLWVLDNFENKKQGISIPHFLKVAWAGSQYEQSQPASPPRLRSDGGGVDNSRLHSRGGSSICVHSTRPQVPSLSLHC